MPIESLAFNSKEKISWLNGSRIYGISLSYDIAIVAPRCGYEFSNSRERQLHEFFPVAAVGGSQTEPSSRRNWCAARPTSKGVGPTPLTRLFFLPLPEVITNFPPVAFFIPKNISA